MIPPTKLKHPRNFDYLSYNHRLAGPQGEQGRLSDSFPHAYKVLASHVKQLIDTLRLEITSSGFPKTKVVLYIEERTMSPTGQDRRYVGVQEEATGKTSERTFEQMRDLFGYQTGHLLGILEQIATDARAKGGNVWRR